jgi:hypothetical protein
MFACVCEHKIRKQRNEIKLKLAKNEFKGGKREKRITK